jgi:hypothetical protein
MSRARPENARPPDDAATTGAPDACDDDWRDVFYLEAFLDLSLSGRPIERREQVWIKRFLTNRGRPHLDRRMAEILRVGHGDPDELQRLVARASFRWARSAASSTTWPSSPSPGDRSAPRSTSGSSTSPRSSA